MYTETHRNIGRNTENIDLLTENVFANDNERKVQDEGRSIRLGSSIKAKPQPTHHTWHLLTVVFCILYLCLRLSLYLYHNLYLYFHQTKIIHQNEATATKIFFGRA